MATMSILKRKNKNMETLSTAIPPVMDAKQKVTLKSSSTAKNRCQRLPTVTTSAVLLRTVGLAKHERTQKGHWKNKRQARGSYLKRKTARRS